MWTETKTRALRIGARVVYGPGGFGAAACIIDDRRLLMVQDAHRRGQWALPGGFGRKGEEPRDAAVREVKEETGLAINLAPRPDGVLVGRRYPRRQYLWVVSYKPDMGQPVSHWPDSIAVDWFNIDDLPRSLTESTPDQLGCLGYRSTTT